MKICKRCKSVDDFIDYESESKVIVEKEEDNVNHPKHYTFGTIEVIDVIEDWKLGVHESMVIKYVGRAKHKGNELEDLKKAQRYLNRKIENIELDIAAGDDE